MGSWWPRREQRTSGHEDDTRSFRPASIAISALAPSPGPPSRCQEPAPHPGVSHSLHRPTPVASKFHSCFEPAAITTPAGDLHPEILDDIMDSLLALQGGGLTAERGTMVERKPKFSPERSFQQEVQSRVEERLAMLSRSRYGGRRIYLKTALLLLWSGASYIALLTWAQSGWQLVVPLSVSLGLALAGIGFNVSLMNGKVLDDTGNGSDSGVASGIVG